MSKNPFFGHLLRFFVFYEKIKTFFKNHTPTFFRFIHYLHSKKETRSLSLPVVFLDRFEIRHLKTQDGRQLYMQITFFLYFSLLLNPSVLDSKYEVCSMFDKEKVFLVQTFP